MNPEAITNLVDAGIPLTAGVYLTLLGLRVVGKRPGQSFEYDRWHGRFAVFFKLGGPLLVLFGLFQIARGVAGR